MYWLKFNPALAKFLEFLIFLIALLEIEWYWVIEHFDFGMAGGGGSLKGVLLD